ncbi:NnrS family protein [Litoreibacter halocynthiae]|uniref:NnrS family protein n=1 Tax=Litoreibacter halocynthiae TaxID=1242689 RepID=UPI002490B92C|nr:NnrS family protein [Litoreibacter halocynthiae]
MATSSAEQMRAWQGPALFSFGFRPFFLFGAVWACFAMLLWIPALSGAVTLPTRFDPVSWHAHAFLFGYLSAVLAGFLLTAVPNWTGRLPLVGWPLAAMFGIWFAGRVAVLFSEFLPSGVAAAIDLAFPVILGAVILREIVAGKNWRNLMVLGLLAVFTLANLLFHIEAAQGEIAAQGVGLRLGVGTGVMMIAVIGGRIVPSFTRNWLAREGKDARPTPPMQMFDKGVLLASVAGLLLWVLRPESEATGLALLALGALHLVRVVRWKGHHTGGEALVWVLHIAYAFIPLGAIVIGLAIVLPDLVLTQSAQHLWMAGAIGAMTLAVMTRATLGHTGQSLHAGVGTLVIYLALFGSVAARVFAGGEPVFYHISGLMWIVAFGGFAVAYGPLLLRRKAGA